MNHQISNQEYEERKHFLEILKTLVKSEQEEVYRILKRGNVSMSYNSNGVFFDLNHVSGEVFQELKKFMEFCKKTRSDLATRDQEMEDTRLNLSQVNSLE
jgi:hypothetical protein